MSLIDATYFVKDISLPSSSYSNLVNEIAKYEPEILKDLLGYELWKLADAYVALTSPQPIIDLVAGKEYSVSYNGRDQKIKWNGLINTEKISLIADYVYYWSVRNKATHTGTLGEVTSKQENSIAASVNQKINNALFRMKQLYGYYGQHILEPSAYNFLKEHEDDYPEWVFKKIEIGNMFGI